MKENFMNREIYKNSELLSKIPGSPDEVGYDISISKIYDDIKNARFEEDSSVSFGVWQRELKKADWALTEHLCVDALQTKSKDFQILGWLIEALVMLDGFAGIIRGIQILTEFSRVFWEIGYPRKDDNSSDTEQKLRISEWIFDVVEKKSKLIPITSIDRGHSFDLYQYEYALELKNITTRSTASSAQILENARHDGHKTLEDIIAIVRTFSQSDFQKILRDVQTIRTEKEQLDAVLSTKIGKNINSFSGLMENMNKIETFLKIETQKFEADSKALLPSSAGVDNREDIYNSIAELARQLTMLEKHSPSAFILNLVVSWKNKNLLEIMDDLKSGTSEAHRLLKQLLN